MLTLPCSEFKNAADVLYQEIIGTTASAFELPDTEEFLDTLKIGVLKAKSTDKADIRIKIHDINTGYETVQGFSIKSRLGSPSTLVNAGRTTNFIFEVFERVFENHKKVGILPNITPGMEWVLEGKGVATIKYDGSCCAIIDGKLCKRYDAKHGKKAPEGAIPCCEPDAVTGHHPHWLEVNPNEPADRWFIAAYEATPKTEIHEGTYEAVGLHFNGNKYNLDKDILVRHGEDMVEVERTFEGIRKYLEENNVEGLVFWKDGYPACKIKRSDFGFIWPLDNPKINL